MALKGHALICKCYSIWEKVTLQIWILGDLEMKIFYLVRDILYPDRSRIVTGPFQEVRFQDMMIEAEVGVRWL